MCQIIAIRHANEKTNESLPRVSFADGDTVVEMQRSDIKR
jgi:hypothetical protein